MWTPMDRSQRATTMRLAAGAQAATFAGPEGTFVADTCAPLRDAGASGRIGLWAYGRGAYPGRSMDQDVVPQLRSVGTWEASTDQDWGLDWHRNEGIEVTCLSAGQLPFSCEDEEYDLTAGHITVTRPWQLHRIGRPNLGSSALTWLILDVEVRRPNQQWTWPDWLPIPRADLDRLTELLSHNEMPVWRAGKGLLAAFDALQRTLRRDASQPMARIAISVAEVFIELRDLLEQQQPALDPYLSSAERTVQLFLSTLPERLDELWTLDRMAAECGLGRTRFVHYCRQLVNVPPLEHLIALRIEKGRALLAGSELRIGDIAQLCGFQSSQYFSTVFRKHTSAQPAQFRSAALAASVSSPAAALP
jgi:AraC family L-rhamnose operon regulatory protein RhaS